MKIAPEKDIMYKGAIYFNKIPKMKINKADATLINTNRIEVISGSSSSGVERKTPVGMLIDAIILNIKKIKYNM